MVLDAIDETEESTTTASTEEVNQLIQQIQQELIVEDKRHFDTLAYYKNRIKEEEEKHTKQQHFLETRLLQAIATVEGSIADGDYWLNITKIQKKEQPKKLTKEEKTLIRSRVKKAYTASKKKSSSKMSSDWNTLDRQAPIPYVLYEIRPRKLLRYPQSSSNLKGNRPRLLPRKLKMIMEFQLVL